jgi:hypothetical protein
VYTLGLVGLLEGLHQVIVSDRSDVSDRAGGEDVLKLSLGLLAICKQELTAAARAAF